MQVMLLLLFDVHAMCRGTGSNGATVCDLPVRLTVPVRCPAVGVACARVDGVRPDLLSSIVSLRVRSLVARRFVARWRFPFRFAAALFCRASS